MPQPRQQEPVAPPPQSSDPFASIGDEDLIDGRTAKQFFKNQDQRYSQMLSGVGEMYKGQVSMLEQNSRILYPDIWKKYGQEIKKEIEQLKTQKFVTAEDYDRVISMIKGQHIDDFLEERVQQALQNAPPGDTGAPALGISTGVATANIPDAWKKHLQEANLTIRDVEQMLDKRRENYGYAPTLEQYFKQMENDVIIKDDRAFKANNLIPERK